MGIALYHMKMGMGIDNWVETGSAADLEKSFTGIAKLNKLLRHFISFFESDTFIGEKLSP